MALINCPECNKEISNGAKICPYCGGKVKKQIQKLKRQEFTKKNKTIIVCLLLIITALMIVRVIQKERDNKAVMLVSAIVEANHNIEEHKKIALTKKEDGTYIYNKDGEVEAIQEVSIDIFSICAFAEQLDECYDKSIKAVNQILQEETKYNFFTWEDYREHLDKYCFLDDDTTSSDIKAEKLVKDYVDAMVH